MYTSSWRCGLGPSKRFLVWRRFSRFLAFESSLDSCSVVFVHSRPVCKLEGHLRLLNLWVNLFPPSHIGGLTRRCNNTAAEFQRHLMDTHRIIDFDQIRPLNPPNKGHPCIKNRCQLPAMGSQFGLTLLGYGLLVDFLLLFCALKSRSRYLCKEATGSLKVTQLLYQNNYDFNGAS